MAEGPSGGSLFYYGGDSDEPAAPVVEIRCTNGILFGTIEDCVLEVKCRSNRCGHEAGTVVIHRFDLGTGKLIDTRKFKSPRLTREEAGGDDLRNTPLRSA